MHILLNVFLLQPRMHTLKIFIHSNIRFSTNESGEEVAILSLRPSRVWEERGGQEAMNNNAQKSLVSSRVMHGYISTFLLDFIIKSICAHMYYITICLSSEQDYEIIYDEETGTKLRLPGNELHFYTW